MKTTRQIQLDSSPSRFSPMNSASIGKFRKMVLTDYADHGRDLTWRRTRDPYHILVSEIMLQQTRVERVMEKYPVFIAAFPDFPSLAGAPLSDVLAVWQGMGYNRRAISLQKCARRVVEEYDGVLPQDPEILGTFPGIGRATASSICAFAFNMPVVFIETNIRSVFIHYFFAQRGKINDKEIVALVAQGFKNKEMAEKMFISEQTVKNHLHNIFDKLGVSDRLELALYAIHNNLHTGR